MWLSILGKHTRPSYLRGGRSETAAPYWSETASAVLASLTGGVVLRDGAFCIGYTLRMSWALRRQLTILSGIAIVLLLVIGVPTYLTVHEAPSCSDNKQNNGEEGIDCGGSCSYVCSDSQAAPSVRFTRALSPAPGRTDVIAYIDNPNGSVAAKDLPYTVELYSASNAIIAKKQGRIDLPPAATVPIFASDLFSGSQEVARAFVTFETPQHLWYHYTDSRVVPTVKDVSLEAGDMPRVTATALNPSAKALSNVTFIVVVFDADGNAIAASQTVAPSISPQGSTQLIFTWPAPFTGGVSRIQVLPVIPLPPAP